VLIDVDCFKAFNDRYGHVAGDDALRTVATCLTQAVHGPDDLASRYGGEEFVAVLPGSDLPAAIAMADRFRTSLARASVPHAASPVAPIVTASIGIATRRAAGASSTSLVAAADAALYGAKSSGRDCIRVMDRRPPDPSDPGGPSDGNAPLPYAPVPAPRRAPDPHSPASRIAG
jgi:diguanylate cyclase (GGDEF)-like protein